jgi:Flp pilus assembly protein TadD
LNESAYTLFARGREFLATGHPHQAVVVLERAAAVEPEKGSIRELLARALYMTGRWKRARAEFAKAVDIDPVNHYAHFGLGLAYERTGDRVQAVAHLKLALAMEPLEEYRAALERLTA